MRSRRNIISAHLNRPPIYGPFMAELDVTYRCNCKCRMCQRWQYPRSDELSLSEYQKLAEAFYGAGVHLVSIAGGEPLLRRDIVPIIKTFADYGMMVNLCTNGMLLNDHSNDLIKSGVSVFNHLPNTRVTSSNNSSTSNSLGIIPCCFTYLIIISRLLRFASTPSGKGSGSFLQEDS